MKTRLTIHSEGLRQSGSTTGYWLDAGFRRPIGSLRHLEWGIDVRYSAGEVRLGTTDVEAGGTGMSLYFGGAW